MNRREIRVLKRLRHTSEKLNMERDTDSFLDCFIECHTPESNSDLLFLLHEYFRTNQFKEHCGISNKFCECNSPKRTFDVDLGGQHFYFNSEKFESLSRLRTCVDEYVLNSKTLTECAPPVFLVASQMPLSTFEKCNEGDTLLKLFLITSPKLLRSQVKMFEEHCSNKRFVNVQTLQQLHGKIKDCMNALNSTANMPFRKESSNAPRTRNALNVRHNFWIDDTIHDSFDPYSSMSTPPMPDTRFVYIVLKEAPRSGPGCQSARKGIEYKDDVMKQVQCYLSFVYHRSFSFTWSYVSLPRSRQLFSPRLLSFMFAEENHCASNTATILFLGTKVCGNATEATSNMKGNTNMETVILLINYMHARSCQSHEHVTRSALPQASNNIIHCNLLSRARTPSQRLDDARQLRMTHNAEPYESSAKTTDTHLVKKRNLHTYVNEARFVLTAITKPHGIQIDTRTRKAIETENDEKEWNPLFQPICLLVRVIVEYKSVFVVNELNTQQVLNKYVDPDPTSNRERYLHTNKLALTNQVLQNGTAKAKTTKKDKKIAKSRCSQIPSTAEFRKRILKTNVAQTTSIQQSIANVDKVKTRPIQNKASHSHLSKKTKENDIDTHLTKLPVKIQFKQDKILMVKANQTKDGVMKPFFRQPLITRDFRKWTVAILKTEVSKTATFQPPTILGQPGMQNEWNRLATFADVRVPEGIFAILLASNGFFVPDDSQGKSTKEGQVECAFCNVVVPIVMFIHVKPMDVHRKVSPRCSVVLGQRTGNLSIADAAQKTGCQFIKQFVPALPERFTVQSGSEMPPTTKGAQDGSEMTLFPNSMQDGSEMTRTQTPSPRQGADLAVDAELPAVKRPAPGDVAPAAGKPGASFAPFPSFSPQRVSTGQVVSDSHADKGRNTALPAPYQTATYVNAAQAPDAAGPTLAANPPSGPGATKTDASSGAPAAAAAAATTAQSGAGPGGETSAPAGRTSNGQERQTVTYEDLGIISQRPKRPDMAVIQTRINTFTGWIHEQTHPKDEMAEAGFYYTGHEDLVRCFHCKGGLKTWESSDTPWVEHARWFPRCPFIRLCKGQRFIDAVQKLNDPKTRPTISQDAVTEEMQRLEEEERRNLGEEVVLFSNLPPRPPLPSDVLGGAGLRVDAEITVAGLEELAERLADENEEIRNLTLCKMCQTSEVNVLFLPCGHLVACAQCAPALTTCAMCRQPVKGSVRVHLDEIKESQREERPPADGNPAMV